MKNLEMYKPERLLRSAYPKTRVQKRLRSAIADFKQDLPPSGGLVGDKDILCHNYIMYSQVIVLGKSNIHKGNEDKEDYVLLQLGNQDTSFQLILVRGKKNSLPIEIYLYKDKELLRKSCLDLSASFLLASLEPASYMMYVNQVLVLEFEMKEGNKIKGNW